MKFKQSFTICPEDQETFDLHINMLNAMCYLNMINFTYDGSRDAHYSNIDINFNKLLREECFTATAYLIMTAMNAMKKDDMSHGDWNKTEDELLEFIVENLSSIDMMIDEACECDDEEVVLEICNHNLIEDEQSEPEQEKDLSLLN